MSIDTIMRPSSNGDVIMLQGWKDGYSHPNYACVDEAVKDENDFVSFVRESNYDLYRFSTIEMIGNIIESITLHAYGGRDTAGGGSLYWVLKSGGVTYGYPTYHEGFSLTSGSYAHGSYEYAVNPITGAAWTREEALALQAGPRLYSWGAGWMGCAQFWVTIKHRNPMRARAQIIGLW
jgi:hypothetical protein